MQKVIFTDKFITARENIYYSVVNRSRDDVPKFDVVRETLPTCRNKTLASFSSCHVGIELIRSIIEDLTESARNAETKKPKLELVWSKQENACIGPDGFIVTENGPI